MSSPRLLSFVAVLVLASAACGPSDGPGDDTASRSGLALTFDVLGDTDVAGFAFTATEVDCATGAPVAPPSVFTATEDLEDVYLPGTGSEFEDAPFDAGSEHIFSDHFFALAPGCYDVTVQPLTADGRGSADCAIASRSGVEVLDGETTEIVLISQCVGDPSIGGLDIIAALNHPPAIDWLAYNPSKFICGRSTTICVSATDVDSDPVSIVPAAAGAVSIRPIDDPTTRADCFVFTFPGPGDYEVTFTAYDMAYDEGGVLVPIEDLLAAQGNPNPSNDTLTVPVHVLPESECITACGCPEGFEPTEDESECIRAETLSPIVYADEVRICPIRPSTAYGWGGVFYPDGTVDASNPFFNSRLNDVGIWGCWPPPFVDDGFASSRPFNEWVGFNLCVDVPETGSYVLGIAGDDGVRFSVNGTELFNQHLGHIFTRWWLRPITLQAGTNIVQIEGNNDTDIGAIGADIYGPFDPALVTSDAGLATLDYESNIIWSTDGATGTFTVGEESGMACPEGFLMNTCGRDVTCTRVQRVPCRD